jgi:hypothetical protein
METFENFQLDVAFYVLISVDRRKSSKALEDTCQDYDSGAHYR